MVDTMSGEAEQNRAQQVEHAIATAYTCRSVIRYNSSLSQEQKSELLAEIDTMLNFLRDRSATRPLAEAHSTAPAPRTEARPSNANVHADKETSKADDGKHKQRLSEIYRIAQLYLSTKHSDGTSEFMARFKEAMATIDEIHVIATQSRVAGLYSNPKHVEDLLENVRGSIADVYSIFIELARAISNALQGSGIYIDTEELSSLHLERVVGKTKLDIAPLLKAYETHVQFNAKKGTIASRIDDATAFLMFLGEHLGSDFDKRDTVIAQLNKVAKLLNDLSYLLSNYESTLSALLKQE